jgi:hypothetical protein
MGVHSVNTRKDVVPMTTNTTRTRPPSVIVPPTGRIVRWATDKGLTINPADRPSLDRLWLRFWCYDVEDGNAQPPGIATMVHDLLRNGRMRWDDVREANVYDLRTEWGYMLGLSPAPWCTHGRLVGVNTETCNQCEIDYGLRLIDGPDWIVNDEAVAS